MPPRTRIIRLPSGLSAKAAAAAVLLVFGGGAAQAQGLPPECGSLSRPWGPFDYRADHYIPESTYHSHKALLAIVENATSPPKLKPWFAARPADHRQVTSATRWAYFPTIIARCSP